MADKLNLLRKVSSLDIAPQFEDYSKIIIHIDDETEITVGDDTGRTLEYTDPFGTKEQAEAQLQKLRGYQYQPAQADGALLDPAAEIGDGISVKNVYFGLYQRGKKFDRLMKANISAPHDEEIDHEFKYETPQERKYRRQLTDVRATLLIQSDRIDAEVQERTEQGERLSSELAIQKTEIAARVSQTGGDNSSFGWSLVADHFSLFSNGSEVFRANADGVEVSGKVNVTSGTLGTEKDGFVITASAIYKNISKFGSEQTNGVYIGTDGIQLGSGFKVDSYGNLEAKNGTFDGTIYAKNISYGGDAGYFNGSGITGGSVGMGQLTTTVGGGVGGGINFNDMTNGRYTARNGSFSSLIVGGSQYSRETISFIDGLGNPRSFIVLGTS